MPPPESAAASVAVAGSAAASAAAVAAELRTATGKLTRRVKLEDQMPLGQVAVLGALDRSGAMTTSDLAADQRVRPQSMARAVGLLMDQGLITRRAHPTDGRKTLLELSTTGQALLEEERGRRTDWLARAIESELTAEERQLLSRAIGLVERLAAH